MSWAKRTACSSGRLTRRLARTDSSSLMTASAIPTIVSASRNVSSRSVSERSWFLFERAWCSSSKLMKSLIPTGRDYIGSEAGYESQTTKSAELRFQVVLTEGGAQRVDLARI